MNTTISGQMSHDVVDNENKTVSVSDPTSSMIIEDPPIQPSCDLVNESILGDQCMPEAKPFKIRKRFQLLIKECPKESMICENSTNLPPPPLNPW